MFLKIKFYFNEFYILLCTHTKIIPPMAIKTLKIGDKVEIKETGFRDTIYNIHGGRYELKLYPGVWRWAHELRGIAVAPDKKKPGALNQVSASKSILNAIYLIVNAEYLKEYNYCQAKLPGCGVVASEVHHKYVRTGYYLIMSKLFLSVCSNCHRTITDLSDQAIDMSLSISRHAKIPYEFTDRELSLMKSHGVKIP